MSVYAPYGIIMVLGVAVLTFVVMGLVAGKVGALKKPGVAWVLVIVMIAASVGIGRMKANAWYEPAPEPTGVPSAAPNPVAPVQNADSYVVDEARVLSSSTVKKLDKRNRKLLDDMDVLIAVITCNNEGDLYDYALDQAEELGLGEYDFVVVMDIAAQSGGLVQGAGLYNEGWFSDEDCTKYAEKYMKKAFDKGDYDEAALSVTEALEEWYYDNY